VSSVLLYKENELKFEKVTVLGTELVVTGL
jgi:hypothetical protein